MTNYICYDATYTVKFVSENSNDDSFRYSNPFHQTVFSSVKLALQVISTETS